MTPVENGDRIRVDKLEEKTADLADEVATLGGELHTHMDQTVVRDRNMTGRIEATLEVAQDNSKQLGILVALDKDRRDRSGGSGGFPAMNGSVATKVAVGTGAGGGLLAAIYVIVEIVKNWSQ